MSDGEDKGFQVVDKRRVRDGAGPAEAAAAPGGPAAAEDDEESLFTEQDAEEMGAFNPAAMLGAMNVTAILGTTVSLLSELAVVHMGLLAHPASGNIERNIPEAKRAIDALHDVVKHLEPHVEPRQKRDLQNMMADLRLNFVQQANRKD